MRDTKMHKRSPLKQKPLRNPGESVQEDIQRVLEGQMLPLALLATLAIIVALDHWWRHFAPRPPQPIWATLIATVVVALLRLSASRPWQATDISPARTGRREDHRSVPRS